MEAVKDKLSKKYLRSYKKYCIADLQRSLRRSIEARAKAELRVIMLIEVLRVRLEE